MIYSWEFIVLIVLCYRCCIKFLPPIDKEVVCQLHMRSESSLGVYSASSFVFEGVVSNFFPP